MTLICNKSCRCPSEAVPASTRNCSVQCATDCVVSAFTDWSPCSVTCISGTLIGQINVLIIEKFNRSSKQKLKAVWTIQWVLWKKPRLAAFTDALKCKKKQNKIDVTSAESLSTFRQQPLFSSSSINLFSSTNNRIRRNNTSIQYSNSFPGYFLAF